MRKFRETGLTHFFIKEFEIRGTLILNVFRFITVILPVRLGSPVFVLFVVIFIGHFIARIVLLGFFTVFLYVS
jgi:hypothetical protein